MRTGKIRLICKSRGKEFLLKFCAENVKKEENRKTSIKVERIQKKISLFFSDSPFIIKNRVIINLMKSQYF